MKIKCEFEIDDKILIALIKKGDMEAWEKINDLIGYKFKTILSDELVKAWMKKCIEINILPEEVRALVEKHLHNKPNS